MKKTKKLKMFAAVILFVHSLALLAAVIVLSVRKKSIPKAIMAVLAAEGVLSVCLLLSFAHEKRCNKRLCETDAFYDEEYGSAFDEDEDYGLGIDENLNPICSDSK
ncbi:MAG: hypothetical protein FWG34_02040 [Oscillospiraceae bacterium]|nr:hypothetical protein [Oscillospiraceae bacterium]